MRRILLLTSLAVVLVTPAVLSQQYPTYPTTPTTPPNSSSTQPAPARVVTTPEPRSTTAPRVKPVDSIQVPVAGTPRTPQPASTTFAPKEYDQTPKPNRDVPTTAQTTEQQMASQWRNIKLDVAIADSLGGDTQNRKTVTMVILDGRNGQIRSTGVFEGLINIDARPQIRGDGRIYLQLTVEYRPELSPDQAKQAGTQRVAIFTESLALMVVDGKPIVASQSSDPRSERKVSIEVTATVQK